MAVSDDAANNVGSRSGGGERLLISLTAGLSGGFASTLVVHPLDLLKIRYQVNEGDSRIRPQYSSYFDLCRQIVRTRGVLGLYQGAAPNILGSTLSWGIYFMVYNWIKTQLPKDEHGSPKSRHILVAGCASGCATLVFTNPLWVVKTRLCVQYEGHDVRYRGLAHALRSIYAEEGVRGLYRGFLPGLVGTSHGALQFMAYEEMKRVYCRQTGRQVDEQLNPVVYSTFAGLSKMFAAASTYPYQVVRSRLQDHHVRYDGVRDVIVKIYRRERWRGFYKGLLANLARVVPANAVTLVMMENVQHALQRRFDRA